MRKKPSKGDPRVDALVDLVNAIVDAIDAGRDARSLVAGFNARAGTSHGIEQFDAVPGSLSPRDFVEISLLPPIVVRPRSIVDWVEHVQRIIDAAGSRAQLEAWIREFQAAASHPDVTTLIYNSDAIGLPELSAAEIVRIALGNKRTRARQPSPEVTAKRKAKGGGRKARPQHASPGQGKQRGQSKGDGKEVLET